MKLVAYADSLYFSGAEQVFVELVARLEAHPDHRVTCAAPPANKRLWTALSGSVGPNRMIGVPEQPARLGALHLLDPRRHRAVRNALEDHGFDAMLINLPSAEYGGTPLLACPALAARSLGLLHIHHSLRAAGFRWARVRSYVSRRALGRAAHISVVAPGARNELTRIWGVPPERLSVFPLPRPSVRRLPAEVARDRLGLPGDRRLVALIGRVSWKQKGHDVLLEAAARIFAARADVCFVVAGEGRDLPKLERTLRERGLHGRFRLLGQVEDVGDLLSAIDAVVIPSRFEGLPLVALEALALCVPGIASDIDGLSDVWPAAWRVPPGDPVALADALVELLDMPHSRRMEISLDARDRMEQFVAEDVSGSILDRLAVLSAAVPAAGL